MPKRKSRPEFQDSADADPSLLRQSSVAAAITVAQDGGIVWANAWFCNLLGAPNVNALAGRKLIEFLLDPADWHFWRDAPTQGRSLSMSVRTATGDVQGLRGDVRAAGEGSDRWISGLFVPVDDLHNLRAVAQRAARMEALGSLTAGIAHDFNNLLTVLVGNLYLVGEELRQQPKVFEKLKAARDAAKRGTELIKQLLAFARREELDASVIDAAKVIEGVTPLLRRALGVRITLETSFEPVAGPIRASAAQLESVVVNLAVNARDAIEGKGRIEIGVRRAEVSQDEAARRRLARGGAYTAISVADTGGGIPPELLDRVFEPFFSTKGERGGTGLGLSMVRWFVEQVGGAVEIRSNVGEGTVVTLLLPQQAEHASDGSDGTMPLSTLPGGTERIIVLSLDGELRSTIRQTLEVLGYGVQLASGVEEMLAALRVDDSQLLMVDGLGRADADVLIRARAIRPGLKIVATADAARGAERFAAAGVGTLVKPFSLADLASVVRTTLDGSGAPPRI
jgi:signal transduction histidine kinase/CheY-like chemotaxis protein